MTLSAASRWMDVDVDLTALSLFPSFFSFPSPRLRRRAHRQQRSLHYAPPPGFLPSCRRLQVDHKGLQRRSALPHAPSAHPTAH